MIHQFKVGDLAQLKSGGPVFTVEDIDETNCNVVFWDSSTSSFKWEKFKIECLLTETEVNKQKEKDWSFA